MTGLGKGLDALFGAVPQEEQMAENDVLKNLKINEVEPNRNQPRKKFDQEALEEQSHFFTAQRRAGKSGKEKKHHRETECYR